MCFFFFLSRQKGFTWHLTFHLGETHKKAVRHEVHGTQKSTFLKVNVYYAFMFILSSCLGRVTVI